MESEILIRLWRDPSSPFFVSCRPAFDEVIFVGLRPPERRVLLDLVFICDDGNVWVNRLIASERSAFIRDIVDMHVGCCGCRGSRCVSNNEVRIVLPGVKAADLEKVFELIYLGYSIIESFPTYFEVKAILKMLAMEIAPELDQMSMVSLDEAIGQEEASQEDVADAQGGSSSGDARRKKKRSESPIAADEKGRRQRIKRVFDDSTSSESEDDFDAKSDDEEEDNELRENKQVDYGKIKSHKCGQCDYSAMKPSRVWRHIETVHDKVKKFKCQKCEYSARDRSRLQRHVKAVHDKIRDFKCWKCAFSASRAENLKIHVKAVHDNIRDYKCQRCNYSASKVGKLKRHVKAVHDKIRDLKCQKCDFSTGDASHLSRHIKNIHNNNTKV